MSCPLCARIAAERDEALEQVRQLKEHLDAGADDVGRLMTGLGLTRREAQFIAVVLREGVARKTAIWEAMYSDDPDGGPDDSKVITVWACKIRQKLAPRGVAFRTVWGEGFAMDAESKAKLRAAAGIAT